METGMKVRASDISDSIENAVWPPAPKRGDPAEPKAAPLSRLRYLWLLIPYLLLVPYVWAVIALEQQARLAFGGDPALDIVLLSVPAVAAGIALAISFRLARLQIVSRIAHVFVLASGFLGSFFYAELVNYGPGPTGVAYFTGIGATFSVLIALGIGLEAFVRWLVSMLRPKPLAP